MKYIIVMMNRKKPLLSSKNGVLFRATVTK